MYWMSFTVNSLYFVTQVHLDPLQLVLVGTALEVSVFVFEVPTGIVADLYSRRLSVIIGVFLVGLGLLLQGSIPNFYVILLAQLLWGVGYTFTSGASQAWISDEIGEEQAAGAFLRGAQLEQVGAVAGIILATWMGNWNLILPLVVSGLLFWVLGVFLVAVMPETGFHPVPREDRTTWQNMADTLRTGLKMVRLRPALAGILGVGLMMGLYSEGFDRLWVAFLLERFTFPIWSQVVWMGILQAGCMILSALALEVIQRRLDVARMQTLARFQMGLTIALVLCLFLFGLGWNFPLTIGLFWVIMTLRQVCGPLYTAWVNHRLDSQARATMLSVSSQVDACGQIAGGPLVGLVAQRISIQAGLFSSAGLLAPVLFIFGWLMKNAKEENEQ